MKSLLQHQRILGLSLLALCATSPFSEAAVLAYYTTTSVNTNLGNPQSLGGDNNTGQSVAFELTINFTPSVDTPSAPIVLWEVGATGSGSALVLENDELHLFAGNGSDDIISGNHGLTATTNDIKIVSVYEVGGGTNGTDEKLSLYVDGFLIASGDVATNNIWAGSDAAGLGASFGNAGARYTGATVPFDSADVINYPDSTMSLSIYRLASSGGPADNTIANIIAVPEPSSIALLALGAMTLIIRRR